MQNDKFTIGLLDFIQKSPTPFHAVQNMSEILESHGFKRLHEKDQWNITHQQAGESYYVTRNDSSIIAFQLNQALVEHGIQMVGAHTDSPCLKVKPNPEITKHHYLQLGVEVYGGALLNPWFDRDLSLAGRVSFLNNNKQLEYQLIDWEEPVAVVPSLAIHLDREANENHAINKQEHLPPVLMKLTENNANFNDLLLDTLESNGASPSEILDYELSFYDVQPPAITGLNDDFISSARLDNLLSCYTGLMAIINKDNKKNTLLVCNDHEEVGSISSSGAQGNFLKSVLTRLVNSGEELSRCMTSSFMVSADNAHAIHPNFADKHDSNHGPIINEGPVIKTNANQRYASNSESSAIFKQLCAIADVPVQSFVIRTDMACGSTIGPITANNLGVRTVDVGVPTLGMHSIRELAGRLDAHYLYRALLQYFA